MAAKIDLDKTVGAVYTDPRDAGRGVLFFGGTGLQVTPERHLDQAFTLLNDDSGTVTGLHEVSAGSLGGLMKCGTTTGTADAGAMAVCGWADNGSLAVALFPGRTVDEASQLMRELRAGIEHRS
jgi:hypothetical protein